METASSPSVDSIEYEEIFVRHPAEGIHLVIAICYAAILVIGMVGNVWVAWMVGLVLFLGKGAKVPRSIQFYILVLCVSDILILLAMSLLLADMIIGEWVFGQFVCTIYLSFDALNKFAAPLILAFLGGTCYASICRPSLERQ
uniref:G-protein coupled receptors family 1 profile domain-containing protein n=1 Tax=Plectus sambesii TaxID=2011161 RepID=A0A914UTR0_9BILA